VATLLVAVAFLVPGFGNLAHAPHIAEDMAHLGYPVYFSTILGAWKVLGAITLLLPGLRTLKEWAYAGMIFDLSGAAVSRGVNGDGAVSIVIPLTIAVAVMASWWFRPPARRLVPAPVAAR
jgi:hypothetical protein